MTYKQIETSREARLWIGQVIVPIGIGAVTVLSNPESREFAKDKMKKSKAWIKSKFKKKEHFCEVK